MDYIQEFFNRQRQILAALMTGESPKARKTVQPEHLSPAISGTAGEAPEPAMFDTAGETPAPSARKTPAPTEFPASSFPASQPAQESAPKALSPLEAAAPPLQETARRTAERTGPGQGRRSSPAAAYWTGLPERGESAVWEQSGSIRQPGLTGGSGGAVDVQAVSRAVERDARRYDGGFVLY